MYNAICQFFLNDTDMLIKDACLCNNYELHFMFKDISFNYDGNESEDLSVYEDDYEESTERVPEDDTNETLVNTMNDDTKDEFEVNLSISLFIPCSFLSKEMK